MKARNELCAVCRNHVFLIAAILFLSPLTVLAQMGYHIDNKVTVTNFTGQIDHLLILVGYPETNQYQTVCNINQNDWTLHDLENSESKYCRFDFGSEYFTGTRHGAAATLSYDVILNEVHFDFDAVDEIKSYDKQSEIYRNYTGERGEYVIPSHPRVQHLADSLWNQSTDIIDYARNCYNYISKSYRYLDALTGLHTLQQIFDDGGGDCGNLSSIFICLMRNKCIPARHVQAYRPNGSFHVWSEFYLEGYGWVPVDVTMPVQGFKGDYFGNYTDNCIVVQTDVNHTYLLDAESEQTFTYPLLQSYIWWWWGDENANPTIKHQVTSRRVDLTPVVSPSADTTSLSSDLPMFDLSGQQTTSRRGLRIVQGSDGTKHKVLF